VSRATLVYSREFDTILSKLSLSVRELVEFKINDLGSRLREYPHHRLKGRSEYRLRVGDYRIIYEFDVSRNILHLVTLGHRRQIYR
jgi:mRNA interferase RelE/StbE